MGYWFRDDEPHWQPSPGPRRILAQKPRPIYMDSSMPDLGKERGDMLLAACEAAGPARRPGQGLGRIPGAGRIIAIGELRVLGYARIETSSARSAPSSITADCTTSAGLMAGVRRSSARSSSTSRIGAMRR